MVGFELELDEKLPSNFTGMQPSHHSCEYLACDHLHVVEGRNCFVRDLWTGESREALGRGEVMSVNDNTFTFNWEGVEITLQKKTLYIPRGKYTPHVMLYPEHAVVSLQAGYLILPRDNAHFEQGLVVRGTPAFETGPLLYVIDVTSYKYGLVDLPRKQIVEFPGGRPTAKLTACHNGLIWWQVKSTLVPTFKDLASPDKLYYSEQKTVTGLSESKFEQCKRIRGSHPFVVSLVNTTGLQVVDLASGTITFVSPPIDWQDSEIDLFMIPGFLNGKFQARCMDEYVKRKMHRRVLREFGVEFDDEFGDFDDDV